MKISSTRFQFGRNWQQFSSLIGQDKIVGSVQRLEKLLDVSPVKGKSFLDIGCGSGLHSLAALKLGANKVHAMDYDRISVLTTESVLKKYWGGGNYITQVGDILDEAMVLPSSDIVYSWGVLHHTGNMNKAILNATKFVNPGGALVLALYGKTRYCSIWKKIKYWYCNADNFNKKKAERLYIRLLGWYRLLRGKTLKSHIENYSNKRGMDFYCDVRDWLGGYPYESVGPKELIELLGSKDFKCVKKVVKRRSGLFGSGCDEYVFKRKSELS
jgi:SAM-dependent methyltransferase